MFVCQAHCTAAKVVSFAHFFSTKDSSGSVLEILFHSFFFSWVALEARFHPEEDRDSSGGQGEAR